MARPPRIQIPGAFYHIYNRGVDRQAIVRDEQDRKTFMQLLGETVEKFGLKLYAYCLMGNHYHLYTQISSSNLHLAMWHLQLNFTRYINWVF